MVESDHVTWILAFYLSPRMTGRRMQVRREEVILAEDADMDCEADLGTTGS